MRKGCAFPFRCGHTVTARRQERASRPVLRILLHIRYAVHSRPLRDTIPSGIQIAIQRDKEPSVGLQDMPVGRHGSVKAETKRRKNTAVKHPAGGSRPQSEPFGRAEAMRLDAPFPSRLRLPDAVGRAVSVALPVFGVVKTGAQKQRCRRNVGRLRQKRRQKLFQDPVFFLAKQISSLITDHCGALLMSFPEPFLASDGSHSMRQGIS